MMLCHVNAESAQVCKQQMLQHLRTISGIRASASGQFHLLRKRHHDSFDEPRPPGPPVWSQLPEEDEESVSSSEDRGRHPPMTFSEKRMADIEEGSRFVRKPARIRRSRGACRRGWRPGAW